MHETSVEGTLKKENNRLERIHISQRKRRGRRKNPPNDEEGIGGNPYEVGRREKYESLSTRGRRGRGEIV